MLKLLYNGAPVRYIGRNLEVGCEDCHHRFGLLSRKWTNGFGTVELTNSTGISKVKLHVAIFGASR